MSVAMSGSVSAGISAGMGSSQDDWFSSSVRADGSIFEYVSTPPKGMTNPPQSAQVRESLHRDLQMSTTALEGPVWPIPRKTVDPSLRAMPVSVQRRWLLRSTLPPPSLTTLQPTTAAREASARKQKQAPPLPREGGLRGPKSHAASAPSLRVTFKEDEGSHEAPGANSTAPAGFIASSPKRSLFSSEDAEQAPEFEICIEKNGVSKVGVQAYGGMLLANPEPGTLCSDWNRDNKGKGHTVRDGDRVVEVNGFRDDLRRMMKQLRKAEVLEIKLKPGWNVARDARSQSQGSPTFLWRSPRVFVNEDQGLRIAGTAPPDDILTILKKQNPHDETWHDPKQQRLLARIPNEDEIRNGREALQGQSRLHQAATTDRYRFCADFSVGAPLCIRGPGVPISQPDEVWASDGAVLTAFHNSAMRIVNRSKLEPNKEEEDPGKRRKKTREDHLELSDSGLFKPRYPIDISLVTLRRLKKEYIKQQNGGPKERKVIWNMFREEPPEVF
mmetsp:Transcript_63077/g.133155  ORF Transcript_63077/g.133155 Transcript_63077/m.133155 type:complete len:500 (-) Transcript_63077:46-1545(-)